MRNGRTRVFVAAASVVCALGMVAACGGKSTTDAAPSATSATESAEDYNLKFAQCLRDAGFNVSDPSANKDVRSELEALDALAQGAGRSEHDDLHIRVLTGQTGADLVAVDSGQIPVQDDDVVVGDLHLGQRFGAVPHDVHRHRLATQPHGYRIGEIGLVLDHQHAHVIDLLLSHRAAGERPPRVNDRGG